MNISEFEKTTGLSRDTIRYYEKIGLLTPPQRGHNGYRYYSKVQLEELAFIEMGKALGFTLMEIKRGYERYRELGHLCPQFKAQLLDKRSKLTQRIAEDRQALVKIDKLLGGA